MTASERRSHYTSDTCQRELLAWSNEFLVDVIWCLAQQLTGKKTPPTKAPQVVMREVRSAIQAVAITWGAR